MHFDLNDDQRQICDSAERLFADIVDPVALTKGRREADDVRARLEPAIVELGIQTLLCPEAHGGAGLGLLGLSAISDIMGGHAAPSNVHYTALAAWLVAVHGNEAQRDRWLTSLLEGSISATFAMSEENGTGLPTEWKSSIADGTVTKSHVENLSADLFIVGVSEGLLIHKADAVHREETDQSFLDVTRPFGNVSFDPGTGERIGDASTAERIFDALLVLSAADAAGAGRKALSLAVAYAGTREQFGRPIGSFQGLKHNLANIAASIEPAKFLCWYAAHAWDEDLPDAPRMAALAKAHACDMALLSGRGSVEAHGGVGYTWEYPLHIYLKRAMYDRAILAPPQQLRERVAELTEE